MQEPVDLDLARTPSSRPPTVRWWCASGFRAYGQFTCLRHAVVLTTCYAHQSQMFVRLHGLVRRGQPIGRVGCTGHCFRPHLHFEVHLAGTWSAHEQDVDPLDVLPRR